MATEKIIVHRFMSRAEYDKYMAGEVLHNDTDHYQGEKGGSVSKGFCFFTGYPFEWAHRLNGLVSFDVLLTVELDLENTDADVYISSGVYADDPSSEYPKRKLYREVCTTAYSQNSMRFVSANFMYASDPRFYSKDQRLAMVLSRIPPIVKPTSCQYPNI